MADVIVVGSGIAGMRAALSASDGRATVRLISRTHPLRSYSTTIQDGINAALGAGDSPDQHAGETVERGFYLADQDLVRAICQEAPSIVQELDRLGTPFNRDGQRDGEALAQVQLQGASRPRAVFADDTTGHVVSQVLYEQVLKAGFPVLEEWVVIDLAVEDGRCAGVVALEIASGKVEFFPAKAVILATGGPRRLYEPSTASLVCSGDGIALAFRHGARLVDMEMVQYHPYVVQDTRLALSELLTAGPVNVVDGAIDLTGHPDIASPQYYTTRHRLGGLLRLDPSKAPVPVRPAMHRLLGGIAVDQNGASSLPGVYAAGECAGSTFHGAYGVPGNFLLESIALAGRAGAAAADAPDAAAGAATKYTDPLRQQLDGLLARPRDTSVAGLRRQLAELMHEQVGPERSATGLEAAAVQVEELTAKYAQAGLTSQERAYNHGLINYLELGHLLDLARTVITSARAREESRGVHVRSDFPARNDTDWAKHLRVSWTDGGPVVESAPVLMATWQPV